MNTQVGQTISGDEFNKLYPVGTTLSADEFNKKYTPKGKSDNLPPNITDTTQNISDVFRSLGLAGIPNAGAAIYEGGRALGVGGEGRYGYSDEQGNWVTPQNPFMREQQMEVYSDPKKAALQTAGEIASTAAWAVPVGKAGQGVMGLVKSAPKLAGLGAVQGGASSAGQEGATLENVLKDAGMVAALNTLLPGVGQASKKVLGETAGVLGMKVMGTEAGSKFRTIEKEVGEQFGTSKKQINQQANDFGGYLADARQRIYQTNSENPTKWTKYDDVIKNIDELGRQYSGSEGVGKYTTKLKSLFNEAVVNWRKDHEDDIPSFLRQQGLMAPGVGAVAPNRVPASVLDEFRKFVGQTIKWQRKEKTGLDKMGSRFYFNLKEKIVDQFDNTAIQKRLGELFDLGDATTKIGEASKFPSSFVGRITGRLGLPEPLGVLGGMGILGAAPVFGIGPGAIVADILSSSPKVGLRLARKLQQTKEVGEKIGEKDVNNLLRKLGVRLPSIL